MPSKKSRGLDYRDRAVQEEILIRQRQDMWTPEQIASLSGHFRLGPGMSLLDAGCGYGYSLRTFGPRCMPGGRLVGVDREGELLETATRLAEADGLAAAATFREGDVYELPFDAGTFDVVMIQVVLCHLAEPERALDELIRVAKPGGCVAVFDNAVGGCDWGWSNVIRPTTKQTLTQYEHALLAHKGRKKLGRGDWSVGLHVPAWMETRGMQDVDARMNERIHWIAPPYRSPGQKRCVDQTRERCKNDGFRQIDRRNTKENMQAAGADPAMIRSAVRSGKNDEARLRAAFAEGEAAFAYGGQFWCIWGFKP